MGGLPMPSKTSWLLLLTLFQLIMPEHAHSFSGLSEGMPEINHDLNQAAIASLVGLVMFFFINCEILHRLHQPILVESPPGEKSFVNLVVVFHLRIIFAVIAGTIILLTITDFISVAASFSISMIFITISPSNIICLGINLCMAETLAINSLISNNMLKNITFWKQSFISLAAGCLFLSIALPVYYSLKAWYPYIEQTMNR